MKTDWVQNFLSPEERADLRMQHKKERDKRICYRINAVLLADIGWSYREIADALLLSDEAVRQHIQEYQASRKIKPENGGSISKLSVQQAEVLLKHLQDQTYLYAKDISAYVKATFGIEYTVLESQLGCKLTNFLIKQEDHRYSSEE